jgi:6-phosphogluconolactonase (cycloisomerase 2 family)
MESLKRTFALCVCAFLLSACGGEGSDTSTPSTGASVGLPANNPSTVSITASVTGLKGSGLVLQDAAGAAIGINGNGSFTLAAAVQSGTAYHFTVRTQPVIVSPGRGQTCALKSGSGVVGSTAVQITVTCADNSARFAYVLNAASKSISAFSIDTVTGSLTPLSGSPYQTGERPGSLTLLPSQKYLYVPGAQSNAIFGYAIDSDTGALMATPGSPYFVYPTKGSSIGGITPALAIDPTGSFVVVGNGDAPIGALNQLQPDNFTIFAIDSTAGSLTQGTTYTTQSLFPTAVSFETTGKYALAINHVEEVGSEASSVSVFALDATSGKLSDALGGPIMGQLREPSKLIRHPNGRLFYSYSEIWGFVSAIAIDPASGATSVRRQGSVNLRDRVFQIEPGGQYAYVADTNTRSVVAYRIDLSTGDLAATSVSAPLGSANPGTYSIGFDPQSRFVYVAESATGAVYAFSIDMTSGALTPVTGSPVTTNAAGPRAITVDSTGRFAFVTNFDGGSISVLQIDQSTGALQLAPGSPYATGDQPQAALLVD